MGFHDGDAVFGHAAFAVGDMFGDVGGRRGGFGGLTVAAKVEEDDGVGFGEGGGDSGPAGEVLGEAGEEKERGPGA